MSGRAKVLLMIAGFAVTTPVAAQAPGAAANGVRRQIRGRISAHSEKHGSRQTMSASTRTRHSDNYKRGCAIVGKAEVDWNRGPARRGSIT